MSEIAHSRAIIAREGWPWLLGAFVLAIALWRLDVPLGAGMAAAAAVLLYLLFRDPARTIPALPLGVLAPVDGRILDIAEVQAEVLRGRWLRVRIRTSRRGAYTVRAPIEGTILEVGERALPGSDAQGLWLRSEEDDNVVLLFPGRMPGFTPKAFVRYGERVGQGQRFAYLRLAPLAELYLPPGTRLQVRAGERVLAGSAVIGELCH